MLPLYGIRTLIAGHFFPSGRRATIGWIVLTCLLLPLFSACVSPTSSGNPPAGSSSNQTLGGTTTPASNNPTAASPTPASGSVTPLNTTITYASVQIAIIDVKQANTFSDEKSTSPAGILRLDLKETNSTASTAYCDYSVVGRLLLPDGTNVAPLSTELHDISIGASMVRNNWIDFPVPLTTKASQLTLQLGKDTEAQEMIPLTAGADVSKYMAKSVSPNAKMTYGKIVWTVTTATSELSYGDKQADKGMMFVVVDLNADNTSSKDGGGDLVQVRLKSGDTTSSAQEFLNAVAAKQTNVKSTVSFIMPQGSTSFTLIFLPSNAYGITTQSSVDFQIG
ncbi:MAG: hypothetical protein H0U76_14695, partial [Ktedonobacteraceae bacterium]|nr:hypothetical protein [Ktedonobacteraceae bacterium]